MFKIILIALLPPLGAFASNCLQSKQILLSITHTIENDAGLYEDVNFVQLFNKVNNQWVAKTAQRDSVIGRKGSFWGKGPFHQNFMPEKVEGDKKSPWGVFRITKTFGYNSTRELNYQTKTPLEHLHVTKKSVCVDDSDSQYYNQVIIDETSVKKDWNSFEKMRRSDRQYRYGALVEHNPENISGKGSCIFLHVWNLFQTGTAGCTAMTRKHMKDLIEKFDARKNPLLVHLKKEDYLKFKKRWCLPTIEKI